MAGLTETLPFAPLPERPPAELGEPSVAFEPQRNVLPPRPVLLSMWRGARGLCPACGKGAMFRAYLKVNDTCPVCQEELYHHRADDAPPYVTILIVGHVVIGLLLSLEFASVPLWVQAIGWSALALALSLLILPRVKGALVALQWALRMHGFETAGRPAAMSGAEATSGGGSVVRSG